MEGQASKNIRLLCDQIEKLSAPFSANCNLQDEYCAISTGLLAARFACFPLGSTHQTGVLGSRTGVSLVSSRLPERRDLCSWWYDILRTACARCDPEKEYLLAIPGTTCFEVVVRASELFGIHRVQFELPQNDGANETDAVDWCRSRIEAHRAETDRNELVTPVILSPQFAHDFDYRSKLDAPLRDVLAFDWVDRVVVLHNRKQGTVDRLCQHYLKQSDDKIIMLAQTPDQPTANEDLIDQGAVPWLLFDNHSRFQRSPNPVALQSGVDLGEASARVHVAKCQDDGPLNQPDDWLCHWTRPFRSAWPDQSTDEFLDELILGCQSADRSALAALIRIIQQQKVIASVVRKKEVSTVSLTAVPLAEFRQRRVFRTHRRRFDFEPYGVAIRKSVLKQLGAQAVEYIEAGSLQVDGSIAFQQPRFDRTGKIDWSREMEWRLEGDLDLSKVAGCDLQIFVNDESERAILEELCPSSVIVVP